MDNSFYQYLIKNQKEFAKEYEENRCKKYVAKRRAEKQKAKLVAQEKKTIIITCEKYSQSP